MKINFGVAIAFHFSGADVSRLSPQRFSTYDEAAEYANRYCHECVPTIYAILNDEYAFYCERSAVRNVPYMVSQIKTIEGGQVETRIWWEMFVKNPEKFIHLGQRIPPEQRGE